MGARRQTGISACPPRRHLDRCDAAPGAGAKRSEGSEGRGCPAGSHSLVGRIPVGRQSDKRSIRKPDLWYHDGDHAVLMRSNLVCHDVRCDPLQPRMRPICPMRNGPLSRHSSSPRRPTAAARPTLIAARSSTRCFPKIARAVNGASSGCSADAFGSLLFRHMES